MRQIFISLIIGILIQCNLKADNQSYGLRFYGQEYEINKRTGLELSPGKSFELNQNFELSFDLSFVKNYNSYFGYIFRIIINDEINLDLIYENKLGTFNTINLIMGDYGTLFSIDADQEFFFNWKEIILDIDSENDRINFRLQDSVYTCENLNLSRKDEVKIFFGLNDYRTIQSTDLPNMNIKNIKIKENGKIKHHWSLNQMEGEIINDKVGHINATVENPFWLYQMHQSWAVEDSFRVTGNTQLTYNPEDDHIYIVSPDSLMIFSVDNMSVTDKRKFNRRINLQTGMGLYYDQLSDRLMCYSIDLKEVSLLDTATMEWTRSFPKAIPVGTEYYHHNKFYNPVDSSLYLLGGYGQLTYKNEFYKIDLRTLIWDSISAGGTFNPRYLYGLGTNDASDTVYIIGGYGSETGDQKLNPRYWNDFLRYIPATGKFEELYTFESEQPENFCFANTLVVDEEQNSFYGLIFSKYIYNGKLDLIKGSLCEPDVTMLADQVPFTFHDILSFSDLYYSESNQLLIAVTGFLNPDETTDIKIYSLKFPPAPRAFIAEKSQKPPEKNIRLILFLFVVIILTVSGVAVTMQKTKRKKSTEKQDDILSEIKSKEADKDGSEENELIKIPDVDETVEIKKSSITLFGGFHAMDSEGIDTTSNFTPLIKELFLLILLNSLPGKRGISSHKLKEILWFDKSDKDARNNRAVNIARLKVILKKIGNIEVSKETGYWKIEYDSENVYIDFFEYHKIVSNKELSPDLVFRLLNIVKNGSLLINLDFDWLDDYKSDVSNTVIDTLLQFAETNIHKVEPNFLIRIADVILIFDTLNEESMILKCRALAKLGKHSLAKNAFTKFCNEYKMLYNEDYLKNFNEVID